ncbi:MAG: TIGR02452 family protein [Kangiellaceae bacterium]|nr:TIGR02452 family protein [Kangiellaceae bacterium]MCW9000903.1 TIGR02452 family protein [Kangiellaceae bacterium]MCW9015880.1 TIGR02452 family protein [Kangiellaceae bacterium]
MNRNGRAKIAQETLEIINSGGYVNHSGNRVDLGEAITKAVDSSQHYDESMLNIELNEVQLDLGLLEKRETRYLVENCTTFTGVKKLLEYTDRVICLNFASSKNPGGGFLGGSQAQEESLARGSALYPCLTKHMEMYLRNRQENRLLYSHDMIYAKNIPVFRDDNDKLLDKPYKASIITSAAVNAGVVLRKKPEAQSQIDTEMKNRARLVLSLAVSKGYKDIVLGAWGCGVFKNTPSNIAKTFYELLKHEGFDRAFESVFFAVLDHSSSLETFEVFRDRFQ